MKLNKRQRRIIYWDVYFILEGNIYCQDIYCQYICHCLQELGHSYNISKKYPELQSVKPSKWLHDWGHSWYYGKNERVGSNKFINLRKGSILKAIDLTYN